MALLSKVISGAKQIAKGVSQAISGTSSKTIQTPLIQKTEKVVSPYVQGFKSAIVAIPATKALELPGVVAKVATGVKAIAGAVGTGIKTTVKANPIKSTAIGLAGAGYVASNPVGATKDIAKGTSSLASGLVNVGGNIREFQDNPTAQNAKNIFNENPLIVSGALATAGAVGYYGLKTVQGFSSLNDVAPNSIATLPTMNNLLPSPKDKVVTGEDKILPTQADNIPITPATQIVGKSATSSVTKRHKTSKKPVNHSQSMRIIINNQSKTLYTRGIYN